MKRLQNLLLIGGTGRNIGKSTLMEIIIQRFGKELPLIALKSSMLMPGEVYFHGKHKLVEPDEFLLQEEVYDGSLKDSQRYLKAGASRSFFLSVGEKALSEAFEKFLKTVGNSGIIIAESNVLREVAIPGTFIMIKGNSSVKPQAKKFLELADRVIPAMDVDAFEKVAAELRLDETGWHFSE